MDDGEDEGVESSGQVRDNSRKMISRLEAKNAALRKALRGMVEGCCGHVGSEHRSIAKDLLRGDK